MREHVWLECTSCGSRNYRTEKETRGADRLERKKFCRKERKHTLQRGWTVADVAHDWQIGDCGRLDRLAERSQSGVADPVLAHANLDADDQVTVGLDYTRE